MNFVGHILSATQPAAKRRLTVVCRMLVCAEGYWGTSLPRTDSFDLEGET